MKPIRILALIDSPTLCTGFSTVGQNLFPHWIKSLKTKGQGLKSGAETLDVSPETLDSSVSIDVWAIGFNGHGYESWPDLRLLPSGGQWNALRSLEGFLNRLAQLDADGNPLYTHCFLLQDTFHFNESFCQTFEHVCTQRGIRSLMYFPVDASLEPKWTRILSAVDVAVAYTKFGKEQAEAAADKAGRRLNCHVLPHGVDTDIFNPAPEQRQDDRAMWVVGTEAKPVQFVKEGDFLMLNVNTNQWRKDAPRSLEILAELLKRGVPAKLVMHCRAATPYGTDLESVGRQLGLELYKDWVHSGGLFGEGDTTFMGYDREGRPLVGSKVSKGDLARMYNAADLVLSTSLGEGWGLSITEALACGTPVAIPAHTSCQEIGMDIHELDHIYADDHIQLLRAEDRIVMPAEMSRVRNRVQMPFAADQVESYYRSGRWHRRDPLPDSVKEWLSWPRIAGEMLELLIGKQPTAISRQPTAKVETLVIP